jgi:hypothetical protein
VIVGVGAGVEESKTTKPDADTDKDGAIAVSKMALRQDQLLLYS